MFYVLPCVILFLCFSVLLALRLPRLGKRELILMLFVRLLDLCLFDFVDFFFLLVSGKGLLHSLDFSLTFFFCTKPLYSNSKLIAFLYDKCLYFCQATVSSINLYHSLGIFSRRQIDDIFLIFPRKQDLTFHANCFLRRQFA